MQTDMDGWSWALTPRDQVLTDADPDHAYWVEAADIEAWIAEGAPPVDGQQPEPPAAASEATPEVPVSAMLLVDKRTAGAILGGKSEDWIERYVLPEVKTVKRSRSVLIPTRELERWVDENVDFALSRR